MQTPVRISFKGLSHSDAIESDVKKKVGKLEQLYPNIISCHVVIDARHHHHHKGNLYHVHVRVAVPEREIVVSHDQHDRQAHKDMYVAIRDAFHAARRQLEEYSRVRRREVKNHAVPLHGIVAQIDPGAGSGLIHTPDGREIHFYRSSVIEGLDRLEPGSEVRFHEAEDVDEPRASSVHVIGKHHITG